jgi:hypothetical protein
MAVNREEKPMKSSRVIRLLSYAPLVVACAMASRSVQAQDMTLKDAIQCKDFKHNSDGSWFAESASLNYGPGKKQQMNFFGTKIKKGPSNMGEPDMWALLNEKCGAGH